VNFFGLKRKLKFIRVKPLKNFLRKKDTLDFLQDNEEFQSLSRDYDRQIENYYYSLHLFLEKQTKCLRAVVARNSDVTSFSSIFRSLTRRK